MQRFNLIAHSPQNRGTNFSAVVQFVYGRYINNLKFEFYRPIFLFAFYVQGFLFFTLTYAFSTLAIVFLFPHLSSFY